MTATPEEPKFAVFVRAKAHPGRGDELIAGYAPVFAQASEEQATELFTLSRSVDDPDEFLCFEIFSSRADFDAHRARAKSGESLDALNEATAEREFVWGVPVWSKP